MAAKIDISGRRYGRLVAIERAQPRNGQNFWTFDCDCGIRKEIRRSHVTAGRTTNCGCSSPSYKHGQAHTRMWQTWKAMKQRCNNPNVAAYHRYGGRGISYYPGWEKFEAFFKWAESAGYADDLELDRIDNDGNYTPENCQFISHKANSQKTGKVRLVTIDGREQPIFEVARARGLEVRTVHARLQRGWSLEDALKPPVFTRKGGT